jgi:hypothetical protein
MAFQFSCPQYTCHPPGHSVGTAVTHLARGVKGVREAAVRMMAFQFSYPQYTCHPPGHSTLVTHLARDMKGVREAGCGDNSVTVQLPAGHLSPTWPQCRYSCHPPGQRREGGAGDWLWGRWRSSSAGHSTLARRPPAVHCPPAGGAPIGRTRVMIVRKLSLSSLRLTQAMTIV